MPRLGDVFDDMRDNGRRMRISCHTDRDAVVVSLWHDTLCRGSFRLAADDLDRLVSTLSEMSLSLRPAAVPATGQVAAPGGPGGPGAGSGAEPPDSDVVAAGQEEQRPEQTGDVTGAASFSRRLPTPRVA
jgi:hypothetical protein